jgi:tetratricopeptide (TPR) repeat protein
MHDTESRWTWLDLPDWLPKGLVAFTSFFQGKGTLKPDEPNLWGPQIGRGLYAFGLCFAFVLMLSSARADRIAMKDGKEVECIVLRDDGEVYEIEVQYSVIKVPKSQVKSVIRDESPNVFREGDRLFRLRQYPEAFETYNEALNTSPDRAQVKIREVTEAWDKQIANDIAGMSVATLQSRADDLRKTLQKPNLKKSEVTRARRLLAHILVVLSNNAANHVMYAEAHNHLESAWALCPDIPELGLLYAKSLSRRGESEEKIKATLGVHLARNADDIAAVELLVERIWRSDPWAALALTYPGNSIRPNVTEKMKKTLPSILLACFESDPYPPNAPMDRIACYQHYLKFVPDANPGPLAELQVKTGRDPGGALVSYGRWLVSKGEHLSAYYAYKGALEHATNEPRRIALNATVTALEKTYLQHAESRITDMVEKRQFEAAHQEALKALRHFPACTPIAALKNDVTSVMDICGRCRGSGRVRCPKCDEDGQIVSKEVSIPCYMCGGRGEVKEGEEVPYLHGDFLGSVLKITSSGRCPSCSGFGKVPKNEMAPCPTCQATRATTCQSCLGKGVAWLAAPRGDRLPDTAVPNVPKWLMEINRIGEAKGSALQHKQGGGLALAKPSEAPRGDPRDEATLKAASEIRARLARLNPIYDEATSKAVWEVCQKLASINSYYAEYSVTRTPSRDLAQDPTVPRVIGKTTGRIWYQKPFRIRVETQTEMWFRRGIRKDNEIHISDGHIARSLGYWQPGQLTGDTTMSLVNIDRLKQAGVDPELHILNIANPNILSPFLLPFIYGDRRLKTVSKQILSVGPCFRFVGQESNTELFVRESDGVLVRMVSPPAIRALGQEWNLRNIIINCRIAPETFIFNPSTIPIPYGIRDSTDDCIKRGFFRDYGG